MVAILGTRPTSTYDWLNNSDARPVELNVVNDFLRPLFEGFPEIRGVQVSDTKRGPKSPKFPPKIGLFKEGFRFQFT